MGRKLSVLIIAVVGVSLLAAAQTVPAVSENSTVAVAAAQLPDAPQQQTASDKPAKVKKEKKQKGETEFTPFQVGVGFKVSSLGFGGDVAVSLTRKTNARFGFNAFNFSRDFDKDGISYNGTLGLKSADALLDFFPFGGGFHLSGGALIYNGNELTAKANVSGGQSFSLDGVDYTSSTVTPVTGSGKLAFNKVAPMFLFGFGNLVPRTKHFSVSFEAGLAYHGAPKATLSLAGTACDTANVCRPIASDTTIQGHIQQEVDKLNNDAKSFKVWPVISIGFGYKF